MTTPPRHDWAWRRLPEPGVYCTRCGVPMLYPRRPDRCTGQRDRPGLPPAP